MKPNPNAVSLQDAIYHLSGALGLYTYHRDENSDELMKEALDRLYRYKRINDDTELSNIEQDLPPEIQKQYQKLITTITAASLILTTFHDRNITLAETIEQFHKADLGWFDVYSEIIAYPDVYKRWAPEIDDINKII